MNPVISPWLRSYLTATHTTESPLTRQRAFIRNPLRSQNFADHLVQRYVAGNAVGAGVTPPVRTNPALPTLPPIPALNVPPSGSTHLSTADLDATLADQEDAVDHGQEVVSESNTEQANVHLPQLVATTAHPTEETPAESYLAQRSPAQLSAELRKTLRRASKNVLPASVARPETKAQQPQPQVNTPVDQDSTRLSLDTATHPAASSVPESIRPEPVSGIQSTDRAEQSMVHEIDRRIQRVAEQRLLAHEPTSPADLADKNARLPAQPASAESGASMVAEIERRIHQAAQRRLNASDAAASASDNLPIPSSTDAIQRNASADSASPEAALTADQHIERLASRKMRNTKIYSQVEELTGFAAEQASAAPLPPNRNRQPSSPPSAAESEARSEQEPQPADPSDKIERKPIENETAQIPLSGDVVAKPNVNDTAPDSPMEPEVRLAMQTTTGLTLPVTAKIQQSTEHSPDRLLAPFTHSQPQLADTEQIDAARSLGAPGQSPLAKTLTTQPISYKHDIAADLSAAAFTHGADNMGSVARAINPERSRPSVQTQPPTRITLAAPIESVEFTTEVSDKVREVAERGSAAGSQLVVRPVGNGPDLLQKSEEPVASADLVRSGLVQKPVPEPTIDPQQSWASRIENNEPAMPSQSTVIDNIAQRIPLDSDQTQTKPEPKLASPVVTVGPLDQSIQQSTTMDPISHLTRAREIELLSTDLQATAHAADVTKGNEDHAERRSEIVNAVATMPSRAESANTQQTPSAQNTLSDPELRIQRVLAEHKNGIAALLRPSQSAVAHVDRQVVDKSAALPSVVDFSTQPLEKNGAKHKQAPPDLDLLARQITPFVKRLLMVEREREPI